MKNKFFSFVACLGLLMGLFAACGGSAGTESAASESEGGHASTESGGAGRYVELDITPPGATGSAVDLLVQGDAITLLTCTTEGGAPRYSLHESTDGGETWSETPQTWLDTWIVDTTTLVGDDITGERTTVQFLRLVPGGGAVAYLTTYQYDDGHSKNLWVWQDASGHAGPLHLATFADAEAYATGAIADLSNVWPVAEDLVLACVRPSTYSEQFDVYQPEEGAPAWRGLYSLSTGELLAELPEWWDVRTIPGGFVHQSMQAESTAYGLDGQPLPFTPVEVGPLGIAGHTGCYGPGGEYYYINGTEGLVCQRQEAPPEVLMGSAGTFASPLYSAARLCQPRPGEFIAAYTARQGGAKLKHYVYDETMREDEATLVVFALQDSGTLRQAVHLFSVANPGVQVTLELLYDEYGGLLDENSPPREEILRDLSLHLLAGDGPDVLVLDGLPLESYAEKGALLDLAPLAETLGLIREVTDPLRGQDGALYAIPARFAVPMVVAQKADAAAFESLAAMVAAITASEPPVIAREDFTEEEWAGYFEGQRARTYEEKPFMTFANPGEVLNALLDVSLPALYDEADGLNQNMLARLLAAAGEIVNNRALTEETIAVQGGGRSPFEGGRAYCHSFGLFISGETHAGYFPFTSFEFLSEAATQTRNNGPLGLPVAQDMAYLRLPGLASGCYQPLLLAGIYSGTSQPQLAEELVRALFHMDTQQWDFYDGLPVHRGAFDTSLAREESRALHTEFLFGGEPVVLVEFDPDAFLAGLATPVLRQDILREAVEKRGSEYFAGGLTAEDAARAVIADTELYFAEHETG